MKIVSVLSEKGGAGKTTVAVHLAVAGCLDGQDTVIIDLIRRLQRRTGATGAATSLKPSPFRLPGSARY